MKHRLEDISFILRTSYLSISKDSVVNVNDVLYVIFRIKEIILLNEATGEEGHVQVYARAYKK